MRRAVAACLCVALLMVAGTGALASSGEALGQAPSILLVSVDTLRADHLGVYGYPRDTDSPLSSQLGSFDRFTSAVTPMPLTVPAHASMLTGLFPRELGILNNRQTLSAEDARVSLPVMLRARGYDTAAVIGSSVLAGRVTGLQQGFQVYLDPDRQGQGTRRRATEVTALASALLQGPQRPLFLMVHYYDVHEPYEVPDRLACLLGPDVTLEQVLRDRQLSGVDYEKVLNRSHDTPMTEHGHRLTLDMMVGRYDAAIRYTTEQVALLLEAWDASVHGQGSLVVITSDHGEGLGQHGFWSHGMNLYQESLQVPLLVRWPETAPGRVLRHPVSLLDLAPTILAAAGVPQAVALSGRALQNVSPDAPFTGQPFVAQRMRYLPRQRPPGLRNWRPGDGFAVVDGQRKFIREEGEPPGLYDLFQDPLEQRNLLRLRPDHQEPFQTLLSNWLNHHPDDAVWPPAPVDPERLRILRSLGYVEP